MRAFSRCSERGLLSPAGVMGFSSRSYSYCGALALGLAGSGAAAQAPSQSTGSVVAVLGLGLASRHVGSSRMGIRPCFLHCRRVLTTELPGKPSCGSSTLMCFPSHLGFVEARILVQELSGGTWALRLQMELMRLVCDHTWKASL